MSVVDTKGGIVREAKVLSKPAALASFFARLEVGVTRICLEAGSLSQWLHDGLAEAGLPVVCAETRQGASEGGAHPSALRHHAPHMDGRQRVPLEARGRGHCGRLTPGHREEENPTASALAENASVGTSEEVSSYPA